MRIRLTALAVLGIALALSTPASACNKVSLTGCKAPELNMLGGLNGVDAATRLAAWRGKPVLIKFWAPSCTPCRKMLPQTEKLYRRYEKKGLKVLAISLGTEKKSAEIVKKGSLTMPVGIDTLQKTMARYKVKAIPATFLVDCKGVVRPCGKDVEAAIKRELKRSK